MPYIFSQLKPTNTTQHLGSIQLGPNVHHSVHKSLPQVCDTQPSNVAPNLISSHHRQNLPSPIFHFGIQIKNVYAFSSPPDPGRLTFHYLITLIISGEYRLHVILRFNVVTMNDKLGTWPESHKFSSPNKII